MQNKKKHLYSSNSTLSSDSKDDSRLSRREKRRKKDHLIKKKVHDAVEQLHIQTLVTNNQLV